MDKLRLPRPLETGLSKCRPGMVRGGGSLYGIGGLRALRGADDGEGSIGTSGDEAVLANGEALCCCLATLDGRGVWLYDSTH